MTRCLSESPSTRPTASWALERHPFLLRSDLRPEPRDLTALPTSAIMMLDVLGKRRRERGRTKEEEEEEESESGGGGMAEDEG